MEKQKQISQLRQQAAQETAKTERTSKAYEELRQSVEQLYGVQVPSGGKGYEMQATARLTGQRLRGYKEFEYTVSVNAPESVLTEIKRVQYTFDHPTFKNKIIQATNRSTAFSYSYRGWGCLVKVGVIVELLDGTLKVADFDMCKSLGQDWGKSAGG